MRLRELKARSGRGLSCSLKKIKHAGKTDGIFCNIITNQEKCITLIYKFKQIDV